MAWFAGPTDPDTLILPFLILLAFLIIIGSIGLAILIVRIQRRKEERQAAFENEVPPPYYDVEPPAYKDKEENVAELEAPTYDGAGQANNNGYHALQDHQMQLMLLEQQNKKTLHCTFLTARQEPDSMAHPQPPQQQQQPPPQQQDLGPPSGDLGDNDFGNMNHGSYAYLDGGDVLDNFDFDSFLHDTGNSGGMFDASYAFDGTGLEAGVAGS